MTTGARLAQLSGLSGVSAGAHLYAIRLAGSTAGAMLVSRSTLGSASALAHLLDGGSVVPVQGALVGDRTDPDGTRAPRFAEAMRARFINTDRTAVVAEGERSAALGANRQPQEAGGRPAGTGGTRPAQRARTTR